MNKKVIRKIYNLYHNQRLSKRNIKPLIFEFYGISIREDDIPKLVGERDKGYRYSDRQLKWLLRMYGSCKNVKTLIKYLNNKYNMNLTESALKTLANRNNVRKKRKYLYGQMLVGRKEEQEIIQLYQDGWTTYQLAERYGYKRQKSISEILKKYDIPLRVTSLSNKENKTYKNFNWDKIDSKEKAYFLGLLLTDGYMNLERNCMGIDLTDEDAISYISKSFNIPYIKVKENAKRRKIQPRYRLMLYGEEHLKNTERLGMTERKTHTLKGPTLTKDELKFLPYIIRGAIDGDGWIRKDGREFFLTTASFDFAKWFKQELENIGFVDLKITKQIDKRSEKPLFLIRNGIKENIKLLKDIVYKEPMGMMRKYNRLMQIQEGPSETIIEGSR